MPAINYCTCADSGLSRCYAIRDADRHGCEWYFPRKDGGCIHFRADMDGHCDNAYAQYRARNAPEKD